MNHRNRENKVIHECEEGCVHHANGEASVEVIRKVLMLCPPGDKELFREEGKAFLCYFSNIPVENENGTITFISGYAVVDNPLTKLIQWAEGCLDREDTDLLSKTLEEAVSAKIQDLETLWQWTSLRIRCQSCKAKGEQCKKQLSSLNKIPLFSFF
jgi:hypothetical protein